VASSKILTGVEATEIAAIGRRAAKLKDSRWDVFIGQLGGEPRMDPEQIRRNRSRSTKDCHGLHGSEPDPSVQSVVTKFRDGVTERNLRWKKRFSEVAVRRNANGSNVWKAWSTTGMRASCSFPFGFFLPILALIRVPCGSQIQWFAGPAARFVFIQAMIRSCVGVGRRV